jgi:hypothetical protein
MDSPQNIQSRGLRGKVFKNWDLAILEFTFGGLSVRKINY